MKYSIYILAGEPSGDYLGSRLINTLRTELGDNISFYGLGGEKMAAEGLQSIFPMHEISIIGFTEIIPHIPNVLRRLRQVVADIQEKKPDIIITIDSPGFNNRVAKKIAVMPNRPKLLHYVAPTVWAYRPERAKQVANLFDRIMVLLPFEAPYFEKEGIKCDFIGHPVVEGWEDLGDGTNFRELYGISKDKKVICVSPGSRPGEVARHLPIFMQALSILNDRHDNIHVVIPTINCLEVKVNSMVAGWKVPHIVIGSASKKQAFAASNLALAKSGTITLELALAKVPTVVSYLVSPLSAWLMRRLIMVRFVNLINIISGREVVPELLQEFCKPNILADALEKLLLSPEDCNKQIAAAHEALKKIGYGDKVKPSVKAMNVVLEMIQGKKEGKECSV